MNYLLGSYYFYDATKQVLFSSVPEFANSLRGVIEVTALSPQQLAGLDKIQKIKNQLCIEAGIDPTQVQIKIMESRHQVITLGNSKDSIIALSTQFLHNICESKEESQKHFKNAFHN